MKTIMVYRLQQISAEKLKNAYNHNLRICWKYVFKKFLPDEYITRKDFFEEKVLPMLADCLDEMGESGQFDVREQDSKGFHSLLEKRYLTL